MFFILFALNNFKEFCLAFIDGLLNTYSFCQKLSLFAFSKAIEKLNKRLNSNIQRKIILKNIEKLSVKSLARK